MGVILSVPALSIEDFSRFCHSLQGTIVLFGDETFVLWSPDVYFHSYRSPALADKEMRELCMQIALCYNLINQHPQQSQWPTAKRITWRVSPLDKVLFRNQYLAVIERDGYFFCKEIRCDGIIVSLLPFRFNGDELEYLARLEVCPAHRPEPEMCGITGGVDPGWTVEEAAQQELWEEAGYQIDRGDLINLGQVRPSKSADTTAHLFAVDVTDHPQSTSPGNGTHLESSASVVWVNYSQGIQVTDPLFVTSIARLWLLKNKT
jgi:8-oxo-dGTP pyrophosphatase MutT (NUDIX family)